MFPITTEYAFVIHCTSISCPTHLILNDNDYPNNIWWTVQIIKLLLMQFSPSSYYILSPGSKYSAQHLILKYPQYKFILEWNTKFHTIQNSRYNYHNQIKS
jgi:hypothetical protein